MRQVVKVLCSIRWRTIDKLIIIRPTTTQRDWRPDCLDNALIMCRTYLRRNGTLTGDDDPTSSVGSYYKAEGNIRTYCGKFVRNTNTKSKCTLILGVSPPTPTDWKSSQIPSSPDFSEQPIWTWLTKDLACSMHRRFRKPTSLWNSLRLQSRFHQHPLLYSNYVNKVQEL